VDIITVDIKIIKSHEVRKIFLWGHAHAECTKTKFGTRGRVADTIMWFKSYRNRLRGFRVVRAENGGFPLTLIIALTTDKHYRAACDSNCPCALYYTLMTTTMNMLMTWYLNCEHVVHNFLQTIMLMTIAMTCQ